MDNFGDWLITQPDYFIVECLGAEKAQLFIRGEIVIPAFKDELTTTYDFDDMRRLETIDD